MFRDLASAAPLAQFVGNVEWVVCVPNYSGGLDAAFRVNGQLKGIRITVNDRFKVYDAPGRGHFGGGSPEVMIESLERDRVLAVVAYKDESRFTEQEKAEYAAYCEREARRHRQSEEDLARKKEENERLEFERLKNKYESGNDHGSR